MRPNGIVLATVAGVMLAVTPGWAQMATSQSWGDNLTIWVTGEARGQPDGMYIELVSEAVAGNVSDALRQCKEKADAAAKAIRSLNIPDCQVMRQAYEFSSPPPADSFGMGRPAAVPALMKVLQVVAVKVKMRPKTETEKLAETSSRIFECAIRNGVGLRQAPSWRAQVAEGTDSAVFYVLEDATPLAKQAIADALHKAEQVKENLIASGVRPGQLVGVTCSPTTQPDVSVSWATPWGRSASGKGFLGPKSAVSASPEQVTVYYALTLTYKIESARKR